MTFSASFADLRGRIAARYPLWGRLGVTAGLLIAAWVLAPRPLTTLTVIVFTLGAALVAAGVRQGVRPGPVARRVVGIALAVGGVAVVVWWGPVAGIVPVAVAVALLALAGVAVIAAVRARRTAPGVRAVIGAIAAAGLLIVALRWPDVAALLTAWLFVLALVIAAVVVALPAPRRRSRGVLSSIALALSVVLVGAVIAGGATLGAAQHHPDDFYAWSDEIPDQPGVLLRTADYDGEVPDGARAARILYTTRDVDDQPRIASAVVAIPTAPANEPRVVFAWQHGTTGVAADCGPSVMGIALTEVGIPGIAGAIERGWAVVATDYPGQGTAGAYPYLIGVGEGRATLDAVRALQQVDGVDASDTVVLAGHSQGGHATLWAAELAGEYAPELDVVGVAALSAATDPYALATGVVAKGPSAAASLIFSYVLVPYADAYPDVALRDTVDPAGAAFTRAAATRCATSPSTLITVLASMALLGDRPLYTLDLKHSAASTRLRQSIADAQFDAPLLLGQGVDDEVIPIDIQRALAARVCAQDRSVTVREYPGKTHMGVIAPGAPLVADLYAWIDRVLAGDAPHGCDLGG